MLLRRYHAGHDDSQGPNVQRVMIVLILDQQLRPLEESGAHAYVVILLGQVELSQPPVQNAQGLGLVIDG